MTSHQKLVNNVANISKCLKLVKHYNKHHVYVIFHYITKIFPVGRKSFAKHKCIVVNFEDNNFAVFVIITSTSKM